MFFLTRDLAVFSSQIKKLDRSTRSDLRLAPIPGRTPFSRFLKVDRSTISEEVNRGLSEADESSRSIDDLASQETCGSGQPGAEAALLRRKTEAYNVHGKEHSRTLEKQAKPHPLLGDAVYPQPPPWLDIAVVVAEKLMPASASRSALASD